MTPFTDPCLPHPQPSTSSSTPHKERVLSPFLSFFLLLFSSLPLLSQSPASLMLCFPSQECPQVQMGKVLPHAMSRGPSEGDLRAKAHSGAGRQLQDNKPPETVPGTSQASQHGGHSPRCPEQQWMSERHLMGGRADWGKDLQQYQEKPSCPENQPPPHNCPGSC